MTPTPEDLARDADTDLAVADAASPGPWRAEQDHLGHWRILWRDSVTSSVMRRGKAFDDADAAFVALAREALPAWLRRAVHAEAKVAGYAAAFDDQHAEIERLTARVAELEGQCREWLRRAEAVVRTDDDEAFIELRDMVKKMQRESTT